MVKRRLGKGPFKHLMKAYRELGFVPFRRLGLPHKKNRRIILSTKRDWESLSKIARDILNYDKPRTFWALTNLTEPFQQWVDGDRVQIADNEIDLIARLQIADFIIIEKGKRSMQWHVITTDSPNNVGIICASFQDAWRQAIQIFNQREFNKRINSATPFFP